MDGVGTGAGRKVGYAGRQLDPGFTPVDVSHAVEAILIELAAAGIDRQTVLTIGRWRGTTGEEGIGAVAVIFMLD